MVKNKIEDLYKNKYIEGKERKLLREDLTTTLDIYIDILRNSHYYGQLFLVLIHVQSVYQSTSIPV